MLRIHNLFETTSAYILFNVVGGKKRKYEIVKKSPSISNAEGSNLNFDYKFQKDQKTYLLRRNEIMMQRELRVHNQCNSYLMTETPYYIQLTHYSNK